MVSEEKMWDYLDGALSGSERSEVEYAIAHDSGMADLHQKLLAMQHMLKTDTEHPSLAFTNNVMRAIQPLAAAPAPKLSLLPVLLSTLPFFALVVMACMTMLSTHVDHSTHIDMHLMNSAKLILVLADSVLLVLFIEKLFYAKRAVR